MPNSDQPPAELALIYDGECPLCTAYGGAVEVDAANARTVRRIDARSDDALVHEVVAAGLDLDEGMVVVHHGKFHHGADALLLMARLAPCHGTKNRLNRLFFGSRTRARVAYPLLRAGRNFMLRLLGRGKIGLSKIQ